MLQTLALIHQLLVRIGETLRMSDAGRSARGRSLNVEMRRRRRRGFHSSPSSLITPLDKKCFEWRWFPLHHCSLSLSEKVLRRLRALTSRGFVFKLWHFSFFSRVVQHKHTSFSLSCHSREGETCVFVLNHSDIIGNYSQSPRSCDVLQNLWDKTSSASAKPHDI